MTLVRLASRPSVGCCSLWLRFEAYYDRAVVGAGNDLLGTPGMGIFDLGLLGSWTSVCTYPGKNSAPRPFWTRMPCGGNKWLNYMYRNLFVL